jgi:antitoxin VapB
MSGIEFNNAELEKTSCYSIYYKSILKEAAMKTAKLFRNGQSQAVRLPQEFRFEGNEVFVKRMGNAVVLIPKKYSWDTLLNSLSLFSEDLMLERNQPQDQQTRPGILE